jgi:hypothetical protein
MCVCPGCAQIFKHVVTTQTPQCVTHSLKVLHTTQIHLLGKPPPAPRLKDTHGTWFSSTKLGGEGKKGQHIHEQPALGTHGLPTAKGQRLHAWWGVR